MSGIGAVLAVLGGAVPISFGATRGLHERWRARCVIVSRSRSK